MEIASFLISLLAIALSAFSFYWVYLRERRSLLLCPVWRVLSPHLEFALTNNGTKEVLVVSVAWGMRGGDKSSKAWPEQRHKLLDGQVMNLKPGQSYRIQSRIKEAELKEFANENGVRDTSMTPEGMKLSLVLEIGWIDSEKGLLSAEVEYTEYSFGWAVTSRPILKAPYDLYIAGKSTSGVLYVQ